MIKKIIRINTSILFLILIVSIQLIYADWSKIKVIKDTKVITYEERAFLRENPQYYLYYKDNEPYIATKENLFNIWSYDNIYNQKANYSTDKNKNRLYINRLESLGYVQFLIDVKPSQAYYLTFTNYPSDILVIIELMTKSGSKTTIYEDYLYKFTEISFFTRSTTERLRVRFYNPYYNEVNNIIISNFWLNEGLENKQYEIIDRKAETYVIEHTDYSQIGSIILNGFTEFVKKLSDPLGFINDIIDKVKELIFPNFINDIVQGIRDKL